MLGPLLKRSSYPGIAQINVVGIWDSGHKGSSSPNADSEPSASPGTEPRELCSIYDALLLASTTITSEHCFQAALLESVRSTLESN